jgi:hypothetical protein
MLKLRKRTDLKLGGLRPFVLWLGEGWRSARLLFSGLYILIVSGEK